MQLYTFFQSGSAYRVRIALALKGIEYEPVYVVIGGDSADLSDPEYLAMNPSGVVPTLVDGNAVLNQTIAIMEYLEETHPEPPLLPKDAAGRSRVRAMAQLMVSDTHPLGTTRVIGYLDDTLALEKDQWQGWLKYWNERGFGALEKMLADGGGGNAGYCHGDQPTIADICLVAQVFFAERFGIGLDAFPTVNGIYGRCMEHPAFRDTHPGKQPDNPNNQ